MKRTSFSYTLNASQQRRLTALLAEGNYRPLSLPHTLVAAEADGCRVVLYRSGKCLVQGRAAEEWVTFTLEPRVLHEARLHYEEVQDPESVAPHMGVDESGKGDYFGPLVIAAVYTDKRTTMALRNMGVRDSKALSGDRQALDMARRVRSVVGGAFRVVTIGPEAYNRLYASMGNLNRLLAWGHARAIENLLEQVPSCPRAVVDQFGPSARVKEALLQRGRKLDLVQRPRAEADPAVAAASILARAGFLDGLKKLEDDYELPLPKGASSSVRRAACEVVVRHGPAALRRVAKIHFRTTEDILRDRGLTRADLDRGPVSGSRVANVRLREEDSKGDTS